MSDKGTLLKVTEEMHLEAVHSMCIESLDPETFAKWEDVVNVLTLARSRIKDVKLEGHSL